MRLQTRFRSTFMRLASSEKFLERQRRKGRARRIRAGEPATVHYFHQVDDPYSHLAVQKLDLLRSAYDVDFKAHLVSAPAEEYQGSAQHFTQWAITDALSIADGFSATLEITAPPSLDQVQRANDLLAPLRNDDGFAAAAIETGAALWRGQPLQALMVESGPGDSGASAISAGNALRESLGHYQSAMFYYDGEWFWGVDRLHLLEQRLMAEGLARGDELCVPLPVAKDTSGLQAQHITLEYFPSLRSPYTAIGHQRVVDLIERSGVTLDLKPVMPMMMRGIPAPRAKQRWIITDAGREARYYQVPFGRIVDPFGEPVKRGFALFPGALELGRGMEYVTAYLSAAWAEGVDITRESGLRQVARSAGLDWAALQQAASGGNWQALLDENVHDMLAAGLWGVPSFRVSGGSNPQAFACWGQDRIWRVENEIATRAGG